MAKLLRIGHPNMDLSCQIILFVIFCTTFSIGTMQSIIPLLTSLNNVKITNFIDSQIVKIPATFVILEFSGLVVGSLIIDLLFTRENVLKFMLSLWLFVTLLFYVGYEITFAMWTVRLAAVSKGIIQPLILSLGAQVYNDQDTSKMNLFFILSYFTYKLGMYGAYSIIPINLDRMYQCNNKDCMEIANLMTSITACMSFVLFFIYAKMFAKQEEASKIESKIEFIKIIKTIFMLFPYVVFWIFYRQINPQLSHLHHTIYLIITNTNDFPKFYTALELIIVVLYCLLRLIKVFENFSVKYATILMTIGGIFVGLWPIIAQPFVIETKDQVRHIKPDAISLTLLNMQSISVPPDIPYYDEKDIIRGMARNEDQIYTLHNDECLTVARLTFRKKFCNIKPGFGYLIYLYSGEVRMRLDTVLRDPYGKPNVCIFQLGFTELLDYTKNKYLMMQLFKNPTIEYESVNYNFMGTQIDTFLCLAVEPGKYSVAHFGCPLKRSESEFNTTFENGGAYLITDIGGGLDVHVIVKPFKLTIFDRPRFTILYIIRAIGEFLLITNGLYIASIQLHPKLRTIGIGLWYMIMKFGLVVFEIQRNRNLYYQYGDLHKLGVILICMSCLSFMLQLFIKFLNID